MKNQVSMMFESSAQYIAGVDEVGRGPLAGPVIAAAVILERNHAISGLRDSKKLSEKKREYYVSEIQQHAVSFAYGRAEVDEIDDINILQASLLAMKRAIEQLHVPPDHVLVDGNRVPDVSFPITAIVRGDDKEDCIAAASIIAKVKRDHEMKDLHLMYPQYGFDRHKGYPTKDHLHALQEHGITEYHRRSFKPVRELIAR